MTAANADSAPTAGMVAALYLRTKTLHVEAERSGIIRDLLRGQASREGYVLLMRNLLPAYRALEHGLHLHRNSPGLAALAAWPLDRSPALESDLVSLRGPNWERDIPLLDAGAAYAERIAEAAKGDGARLIAHAYTRYLGDLSGGLILQKLLARALDLTPSELSFYSFPNYSDLAMLKSNYRDALERAGAAVADITDVIEEGAAAFALNIDLSWAVHAVAPPAASAAAAE